MSSLVWIAVALGIGVLLSALVFWLWWRGERQSWQTRLAIAEQSFAQQQETRLQAEELLCQARAELQSLTADLQDARVQLAAARTMAAQLQQLQGEHGRLQEQGVRQSGQLAELQERLLQERRQAEEKQRLLSEAEERLRQTFAALSSDALRRNNEDFLRLAHENLTRFQEQARQDWEGRQNNFGQIVAPIRESLGKMNERLDGLEQVRNSAYSALTEQLRGLVQDHLPRLHEETAALVKALRQPAARGRWGEMQLKRVVEMAGMLSHCDFIEQASIQTEDGVQRPDLLVRLPGNKQIIVDAKAPLNAYLQAVEARDDTERQRHLLKHAAELRTHLQQLGRKSYWEQLPGSPEFVVLFLPGEDFFSAALQSDPSLIEYGMEQKVIVATPTTLIALLRAAAYGWRQEAVAANAQAVSALGRELHDRLLTLSGHWSKAGRQLQSAVQSYNQATASLETRVLVSARKFPELGATIGDREISTLEPVELQVRNLQVRETEATSATDDLPPVSPVPRPRED
ncbi:DNA recombination protein RmuC [Acidithiobacillus sp. IBUN Pt1247-S3]|uniref:DNA recombination protein RmuC n=1 Tax=Acidithiobacillus sp. IBUN Pt1247-S3 TaxID=3166642 RepID=UPI0034E53139